MKVFILIIAVHGGGVHTQQVEIIGLQNCINAKEVALGLSFTDAKCIWTGRTQQ